MSFENIAIPAVHAAAYGGNGAGWEGHMMYGGWGGWMHPFGGIGSLLLIFLVGYLVVALIRRFTGERGGAAADILKVRFARGEITREELDDALKSVR